MTVALDCHYRHTTLGLTRQVEIADIHPILCHQLCNRSNRPWCILVKHDQSRILPGKGNLHSIHPGDQDIPPANTAATKRHFFPVCCSQSDLRSIRVRILQFTSLDLDFQSLLFRHIKGKTDTLIICLHSQYSRYKSLIRAVSLIGFRKRTMQKYVRFHRSFSKKSPCHQTDPGCSRSV